MLLTQDAETVPVGPHGQERPWHSVDSVDVAKEVVLVDACTPRIQSAEAAHHDHFNNENISAGEQSHRPKALTRVHKCGPKQPYMSRWQPDIVPLVKGLQARLATDAP